VRIRGRKGARPRPARRVKPVLAPRQGLLSAEGLFNAGSYEAAADAARAVLIARPASLELRLRAQVVVSRSKVALDAHRAGVAAMDEALVAAHAEGASPIQLATSSFWRAHALAEAGRVLEALSNLDAVDEAFVRAKWFADRFRLDGVTGLEREVQATPLLRARVLALRCWLRRTLVREGHLGAAPEGLLDQAEACRLAPRDSLVRQLLTRPAERPSPLQGLRRWRLDPLPNSRRLRWLAAGLRARARPRPERGLRALQAWEDAERERTLRVVRAAWRAPENSRSLIAIGRALALLGAGIDDRRQAAALLVRRARTFKMLGEDAQAKLDEDRGRALMKANLGPTSAKGLRLETDLARLAFWGGDFELARRQAEKGLTGFQRGSEAEVRELTGQLWACHGLSFYVLVTDRSKRARAQILNRIAPELWLAERSLGALDYSRWVLYAEREAKARYSGSGTLSGVPSREPTWTPGVSCGNAGGPHQGPGPCRGAACKPSLGARLLRVAGRSR